MTKKNAYAKMGYKETKLITYEINTYHSKRYEGKKICYYYSGKYSRLSEFKNHGYGNYEFTKVKKIRK
ncbi:MAG: hypothetical protein K6F71_16455 [Ruminococcus sp.]|uniref:hypothetical protein n=1 Tax=Ruminococcus sp. TaxID=41978 RepID=UPI0025CF2697|nr:hypothetical protein [Ruminococcus sp.]MCR5542399.1 hypothetical protein [Ruminococcus sp.]